MLNKITELVRRRRLAMGTILLAGAAQLGCYAELPPVAAEQPAAPAPAADQPADGAQADAQQDDAKVEDFYEPLASYGTWVDTQNYGRVWQPSEDVAGDGFTPYASDGAWTNNDDGDYVFQSKYDTEFGWATYHYGRWAEHDDYGWVWIPGTTWAPSWVEWRYGGGYVGWAPLGPVGYVTLEDRWFFTEQRYFGSSNIYNYRLGPDRVHLAYTAASPLVEVHGRGRWTAGPPLGQLRAAGVAIRSIHAALPARGYVKAQARAVKASAARAGRTAAPARTVHRASRVDVRHDAPARHDAPTQREPAATHREAPAHHEVARPAPAAAPKPRPAPAAAPRPSGKKRR